MFAGRDRLLLGVAAVVVAAVVWFQLAAAPGALPVAGVSRAEREGLERRVSTLEARLAAVTIPSAQAAGVILRTAQSSAAATGMTIVQVRPRPPAKSPSGCLERAMEIQVRGRFPDLTRFLFRLEAGNQPLRVTRISMSSADNSSDQVNCTLVAVSYSPGGPTNEKTTNR